MYSNLIPGINDGNPNSLGGLNWGRQLSADNRRKISKFTSSKEPTARSTSSTKEATIQKELATYEKNYNAAEAYEDDEAKAKAGEHIPGYGDMSQPERKLRSRRLRSKRRKHGPRKNTKQERLGVAGRCGCRLYALFRR